MQEFYITNKKHPEDTRSDLSLIFIELVKYKPKDRGSRAIKELWLRFLTEIDEQTQKVDDVLLENPDINQALQILETSAYSDGDMYAYNDALLEIMTHRNAMKNEREDGYAEGEAKGRAEGRVEGRAEGIAEGEKIGIEKGEKQAKLSIARTLLSMGTMTISEIAAATDLPESEINNLN
jgi:predicted transposase/invertase (TIGR01784 family)